MTDRRAPAGGKVALITGAGGRGGIGRAIAQALTRDGVSLALTDVRRDPATLPPDEQPESRFVSSLWLARPTSA